MCLAIYAPAGIKIPAKGLIKSWVINHDGAGYMFRDMSGKVKIKKGFGKLTDMYKSYMRDFNENPSSDFGLHLRKASKGGTSLEMTHPFPFGDNGALIHNGTISELGDSVTSDSSELADLIGGIPEIAHSPELVEMLEGYVGRSRVVVFQGETTILLNRDGFEMDDGVFYSNKSYKDNCAEKEVTI